jgi:hypothetical protein
VRGGFCGAIPFPKAVMTLHPKFISKNVGFYEFTDEFMSVIILSIILQAKN